MTTACRIAGIGRNTDAMSMIPADTCMPRYEGLDVAVHLARRIGMPREAVDHIAQAAREWCAAERPGDAAGCTPAAGGGDIAAAGATGDTGEASILSLMDGMANPATAASSWRELKQRLAPDPDGWRMLSAMLHTAATRTAEQYRRDGISEAVYLATMRAFTRFTGESVRRYGRLLFDRDFWTWRHLALTLFRVGALEYEHALAGEGVPGETGFAEAVNVHIPSDADLSGEAVDASLAAWQEFAGQLRPAWSSLPLCCESWLLSPSLAELLPTGSRILAFQQRFDLVGFRPDAPDWREWIFDTNPAPVAELPEHTGLQRAVKRHLLAGGVIGVGIGVLRQ